MSYAQILIYTRWSWMSYAQNILTDIIIKCVQC